MANEPLSKTQASQWRYRLDRDWAEFERGMPASTRPDLLELLKRTFYLGALSVVEQMSQQCDGLVVHVQAVMNSFKREAEPEAFADETPERVQ